MPQTVAADIETDTRPKISFADVNKFYGNNRAGAATTLALDDFSLRSEERRVGKECA